MWSILLNIKHLHNYENELKCVPLYVFIMKPVKKDR